MERGEQSDSKTYQCGDCGLWYKDEEISRQCQAWCKEHKSWNLEIIKHSIKHMTNNNSQPIRQGLRVSLSRTPQGEKGFAIPVIIAIVAVVLALGGVVYYANQPKEADKIAEEKAMMEQKEKDAMMEKEAMMTKKDVVLTMRGLNASSQMGTATLSDMNGKTRVVINILAGVAGVAQPAHIHMGACPNPGAVLYPLTAVANGKSETVLDVSLDTLSGKLPLAINVHKSKDEAKIYTSCGDLPKEVMDAMMEKNDGEMMKDNSMMKKDEGAMMNKGETMMKYSGMMLAGKSAPLLDFTKADYDAAIKTDKLVVLYFYANWCPVCKEETANALYPAFNELTTDNVVGIRINYKDSNTDSDEKALAVKYGIPYQHTKVLLRNGTQILKAPDSWDKARYLAEINKALTR